MVKKEPLIFAYNLGKGAFLLAIVTLVSFLMLEATLLICDTWVFRNSLWVFDPDLGLRVRPYAPHGYLHRANRFGFNDDDYPLQRMPGTFRVLILGDSFNWAGARDWNYVDFLERKLKARFKTRLEVINIGYPGTHTAEQLKMLQKLGMRYQPDLVVLGFFAGNDFVDASPLHQRIAYGGEVVLLDPEEWDYPTLFGMPVLLRSRLLVNLKGTWLQLFRGSLHMSRERFLNLERGRMRFADFRLAGHFAPHVDHILSSLRSMRDLVTGEGSDFLVIAYPDEFQVNLRLRQEIIDFFNLDAKAYRWARAQELLDHFCHEENIEFYDLLPAFQEAARQNKSLYIRSNSHWNQAGNEFAAELIRDILEPRVQRALADSHDSD